MTLELRIQPMSSGDLDAVAGIYFARVQAPPPASWRQRLRGLLDGEGVALVAANTAGAVVGYLVGEVRSWEFGSPPAGWVFGLAVAPAAEGGGVGRRLLELAVQRFRALGVSTVRTMVRRDDVDVLRFFRGSGFVAGPYTELELDLEGS